MFVYFIYVWPWNQKRRFSKIWGHFNGKNWRFQMEIPKKGGVRIANFFCFNELIRAIIVLHAPPYQKAYIYPTCKITKLDVTIAYNLIVYQELEK